MAAGHLSRGARHRDENLPPGTGRYRHKRYRLFIPLWRCAPVRASCPSAPIGHVGADGGFGRDPVPTDLLRLDQPGARKESEMGRRQTGQCRRLAQRQEAFRQGGSRARTARPSSLAARPPGARSGRRSLGALAVLLLAMGGLVTGPLSRTSRQRAGVVRSRRLSMLARMRLVDPRRACRPTPPGPTGSSWTAGGGAWNGTASDRRAASSVRHAVVGNASSAS
jgi:hypothetical protein